MTTHSSTNSRHGMSFEISNHYFEIGLGICIGVVLLLVTITFIPFKPDVKSNVDFMDIQNKCRPVPDNYNICGGGIIHKNGVRSEFIILNRANGDEIITDCISGQYPYGFNETGYHCADGIWKDVQP